MSFYAINTANALKAAYTGTAGSLTGLDNTKPMGFAKYKLVTTTDAWVAQGIADIATLGLAANDTFATPTAHGLRQALPVQLTALGDTAVSQAWQVSVGNVFVDVTATLNDATANNTQPFTTGAIGDYFAVGYTNNYGPLKLQIGTAGTVGAVAWEYWNGTAWTALAGVVDNTTGFKAAAGTYTVTFTIPADWAPTILNGSASLYYVRARVTTGFTVNPLLTQGWVDGTLPTGTSAATTYWAIVVDATHFKLATTQANAIAGVAIDITTQSAGTIVGTVAVANAAGSAFLPAKTLIEIDGSMGTKISVVQDAAPGNASIYPVLGVS